MCVLWGGRDSPASMSSSLHSGGPTWEASGLLLAPYKTLLPQEGRP